MRERKKKRNTQNPCEGRLENGQLKERFRASPFIGLPHTDNSPPMGSHGAMMRWFTKRERARRTNGKEQERKEKERGGWTVATSRKQSGRRPLKILLRIVCHFTSERSRRMERAPLSSLRGESARTNLGVHRFVRYYLHIYVGITYKALLLSPTDAIPRWLPIFQIHQTPPLAPIIP